MYNVCCTVETRIKEPTFLGDRCLKVPMFCFYNSFISNGEKYKFDKDMKKLYTFIKVASSPIIHFNC